MGLPHAATTAGQTTRHRATRRHLSGAASLTAVCAFILSVLAATPWNAASTSAPAANTTTASSTTTTADPLTILILGDSYSSGNGARDASGNPQIYGPPDCRRSKVTWGELYAADLRAAGHTVEVRNAACSGAKVADFTQPRKLTDETRSIATPRWRDHPRAGHRVADDQRRMPPS